MYKFIKFLFAAIAVFALASCLKDDKFDDNITGHDLSDVPKVIEIGYIDEPVHEKSVALDFIDASVNAEMFYIRLAAGEVASEDITVTIDSTGAYSKLLAAHPTYKLMPASFYTYETPTFKVVIPKGERQSAPFRIKTNASRFDPSTTYGLYFRIVSVDKPGYVISQNFGEFISIFSAKNSYDGVYSVVSGQVQRYTAPGVPTVGDALNGSLAGNRDVVLITLGAYTNSINFLEWHGGGGIGGIDNLRLTVDPVTNNVTVSALGNATLANWIGKVNKYDPATRTFTLNFDWNQTANRREYSIIFKYIGPR
jgi:hypothetical protein